MRAEVHILEKFSIDTSLKKKMHSAMETESAKSNLPLEYEQIPSENTMFAESLQLLGMLR